MNVSTKSRVPLNEAEIELQARYHVIDRDRLALYEAGLTYEEIGLGEDVRSAEIKVSCTRALTKLGPFAAARARNSHLVARVHGEFDERALAALDKLLTAEAWQANHKGLEHWRKVVGLDTGTGVNVNVQQNNMNVAGEHRSFESVMGRVKAAVFAETQDAEIVSQSVAVNEIEAQHDENTGQRS